MKHGGGRPSKYDPKYCEEIIEYMAQGGSKEAFAGHVNISKQTIYNWAEQHTEFLDAIKVAETKCQEFWEDLGKEMVLAGQGNATVWIFNMKNRFSWKDRNETELVGQNGGPIQINIVNDYLSTFGGTNAPSEGSPAGQDALQSPDLAPASKKDINTTREDGAGSAQPVP